MQRSRNFCGRTRREFLWEAGAGFAGVALAGLLGDGFFARRPSPPTASTKFANPLAPKKPHFAGQGEERHLPVHVRRAEPRRHVRLQADACIGSTARRSPVKTFGRGGHKNEGRIVEPKWKFKQYGQCGKWVSDLFPHLASCVDDIAFLHSMTADSPIHGSAMLQMNTGKILSAAARASARGSTTAWAA